MGEQGRWRLEVINFGKVSTLKIKYKQTVNKKNSVLLK